MAIDPKKLGRLTEVIRRFTDPNEGSAISAFNGFRAMCKGQHIDLRDYEVRKAGAPAWEAQQLQATTQELEMARDRIEELVREHAEESRDLRADIRSLDSELSAAKATITKLRQRKPPNTNNGVDKVAALEAELGAAKKTIAQLHTNNGVDAAFWKDAYDRAEAELNTYRDP
jgi:hypothetical protein